MVVLSVTYPRHSGTAFDYDYYSHKHLPMVRTLLQPIGLSDLTVYRGTKTPEGAEAPYEVVALLSFPGEEELLAALDQHAKQILGDICNFTDMKPNIQLNVPVG